MRRLGRVVVAAALGGALLGMPAVASAVLTASSSQTNTFSAGSLGAPGTAQTIHPTVTGAGDGDVRLTWTDTLSRAITYQVQRAPAAAPTSWATVNGAGSGSSSTSLCTGSVPGAVSCTYDDNATNSTSAPAYDASYVYQVVAKVGGWTNAGGARYAGSLPPASGTETYLVPPDLNAVSASAATSIWAVGANCTVDYFNGTTWTLQTVPTSACPTGTSLNGVAANGGAPMVVGGGGVAFICTAGCATATPTWTPKNAPVTQTLYAVSAASTTQMWAVGANCTLLSYNGTTWSSVTVATAQCAATTPLYGVQANGSTPIVAGAAGTLFTCTANCTGTGTPAMTNNAPVALAGRTFYAVSATTTNAWAVGSGGAIAVCTATCTGSGASWSVMTSPTTNSLRGVNAFSSTLVEAVGDAGTVIQCTASCNLAGGGWSTKVANTSKELTAVLTSTGQAIAVGIEGTIITAGGWALLATGVTADLNDIDGLSASSVWAVGANCTVLHYDGVSWSQQAVTTAVCPAGTSLNGVAANGGSPMVVGANGVTFICTGSCTSASPTWATRATPGSPTLNAVAAQTTTAMWAAGPSCTVLFYNGTTWTAKTPATSVCAAGTTLNAVAVNVGNPVFAGANATLFTCSGGCTTTPTWDVDTVGVPAGTAFYGLADPAPWAAGSGGAVAVCSQRCAGNGAGASWVTQSSGTSNALHGVDAIDTSTLIAVGDAGTIRTCAPSCTGGAVTWVAQASPTTANLTGVYVVSSSVAFAVGAGGTAAAIGIGAFVVTTATSLPVNVPTTYALVTADLTQLSSPDSVLYALHGAWPSTALPATCTTTTPGIVVRPASTVPTGTWALNKAVATVSLQVTAVPSGGAAAQLLVSPNNGTSWTAYPLALPTAAGTSRVTSADVTTTLGSTTALATTQLCVQGSSGTGPALTASVDLVHLDVN